MERTRKALEASIQHWRDNLAAETPNEADTSADSCALCGEFAKNLGRGACQDCPVHERTGVRYCAKTPYVKAYYALERWRFTQSATDRDDFRVWAKAEVELLESLR